MPLSPTTRKLADELTEHFFVPFDFEQEIINTVAVRDALSGDAAPIATAFLDSVRAVVRTTASPFMLANAAAREKSFFRFSMAERIRARSIDAEPNEDESTLEARRNEVAGEIAHRKYSSFAESEEGVDALVAATAHSLLQLHQTTDIACVARELLYQGLVSTWSTLEVVTRDSLILVLDANPTVAKRLLADSVAKKRFAVPPMSVEELEDFDFDLSRRMGSILLSDKDFSNFQLLRAALEAVFESDSLCESLGDSALWHLNQKRHLIVHRRGLIDHDYIRNVGCSSAVGEMLSVSPSEFEVGLRAVLKTGGIVLAELLK